MADTPATVRCCQCEATVTLDYTGQNVGVTKLMDWVFDGSKWLCPKCLEQRGEPPFSLDALPPSS